MSLILTAAEDTSPIASIDAGGIAYLTNGSYRTAFARAGFGVQNGTTVADPPANRWQTSTFSSSASLWVHANFQATVGTGTTSNEQILLVRSPDGVSRIVLRQTGVAGTMKVSTRNAAGSFVDLGTASGTWAASTNTSLDLFINYVGAGAVKLYLAGVLVVNFSGDPRTDAATTLNRVDFASVGNGSNAGNSCTWSEIIIADEDTRAMALWTLAPQAAGNTQSWTPNTLGNINKATINDGTLISTSTNNALSQWTTPTSAPAGNWDVKAIVQEARVEVGTTGPQHFDWSLRTASTDFTGGASNAPTTSFSNFNNFIWATNPNTSAAWAIGDIASGFNLGIKALA
jgi:hypothetical protein